jgi:hypothetical protein
VRAENYFSSNPDLTTYYDRIIDWERLVPLYAEADDAAQPALTAASWREGLSVAGELVGREG